MHDYMQRATRDERGQVVGTKPARYADPATRGSPIVRFLWLFPAKVSSDVLHRWYWRVRRKLQGGNGA